MHPGLRQLTLIPSGASSAARQRANERTAAFVALYTENAASPLRFAHDEINCILLPFSIKAAECSR